MASPNEARPRRALRSTGLVAAFAAAFVATSLALRRSLPGGGGHRSEDGAAVERRTREGEGEIEGDRAEIKLDHFRAHRDDYSVLFLGSSRTFRGFVPEVFDARMRERGIETRSFNFGVPGSRAAEMLHMLGRVARSEPRGIELVLVDPEGLGALLDERNFETRAVIDWHDPSTTALVSRYVLDAARGDEREVVARHWMSCAYNVANVGRGLRWVDAWLGIAPDAASVARTLGPRLDGYVPRDDDTGELAPRARRFQNKKREEYEALVAGFRSVEMPPGPPAPAAVEMFRRIAERVRALGAAPIFVTQPGLHLEHDLIKAAERGDVGPLLRFDGPDRRPELYAAEHRFDINHLNDAGARVFSEMLAREVASLIERGEVGR